MNIENRIPGHSVNKGYPFDIPISQVTFKDRPVLWEKESGQIAIDWEKDKFDPIGPETQDLLDFCLHRLIDYQEALKNTEGQILDMLSEKPFMPEDFGFEVVVQHTKITEQPLRVYQSKLDENVSLYRKPGDPGDENWNPSLWVLMKNVSDDTGNKITTTELDIPCERVAYAALFALGIKLPVNTSEKEEEYTGESIMAAVEPVITPKEKVKDQITVKFERKGAETHHFDVIAKTEEEAVTKANFLLQADYGVMDAKTEEFFVIP